MQLEEDLNIYKRNRLTICLFEFMRRYPILFIALSELCSPINSYASGPLTLPFTDTYPVNAYYDLDSRKFRVFDFVHRVLWDKRLQSWEKGYAYDGHFGTDFGLPAGTSVAVVMDGTIIKVKDDIPDNTFLLKSFGNVIWIDHGNGLVTIYGHLKQSTAKVKNGDVVCRGQIVALSNNTGTSTGPHLHFEVRINGNKVDPYENSLWTTNPPSLPNTTRCDSVAPMPPGNLTVE